MFSEFDAVISRFVLKEKEFLVNYPSCDLELVFVELPKFQRSLAQLDTLTDKWMYFLQNTRELEAIPETMGAIPEIRQAFEVANQANLNREELEELDHQSIFIQDQRNAISLAKNQGKAEGLLTARVEIAQRLLDSMDDAAISQVTGLSIAEVEALRSTIIS